jgi:hypothetical protein
MGRGDLAVDVCTRDGSALRFCRLALPFEGNGQAAAASASRRAAQALARQIERHEHWPICSVHLWFDREITDLEHAVLLDREIHWMYNQSRCRARRQLHRACCERHARLCRAAARGGDRAGVARAGRILPARKGSKGRKSSRSSKKSAPRSACLRGSMRRAPPVESPWENLFLAGDWVRTGWPSTMESAARSGHLAAEAVCAAVVQGRSFWFRT